MADKSAPIQTYPMVSRPGVQRDGTRLDSTLYQDGQWIRFQRGRPKKMGGYRAMTQKATGPFRSLLVDRRAGASTVHTMSPWGIERLQFDPQAGAVGTITDRTPAGGGGSGAVLGAVTIVGGAVTAIAVTTGGSQYLTPPLVFIADGTGTGAAAHAVLTFGVVTSIVVDTGGSGYVTATATVVGFAYDPNYTWQQDLMYAGSGSTYTALIASSTPDLLDISSDTAGTVWSGDASALTPLTPLLDTDGRTPITTSGGICVLQPFLVVYGSNGMIRNSDANQISGLSGWQVGGGGFANTANVAGTKIVKGLPLRGGSGAPAGLFWSLDSLILMSFVGGTNFWSFDTVSDDVTILAKNSVVEYDGVYYWMAVDRFMAYSGVVQEVPNQQNLNYIFDNLNYQYANAIFAVKIPRYGEIHWYYPRGASTECNACVIYNTREQVWYDNSISRSAGASSRTFPHPVLAGTEDQVATLMLPYANGTAPFSIGDTVQGGTSGATATVYRTTESKLNLINVSGGPFLPGETLTDTVSGATCVIQFIPTAQQAMAPIWAHEIGHDKVSGQNVTAIKSYFQTNQMGFPTGGPMEALKSQVPWMDSPGAAVATRVVWIEPDAIQLGDMTVEVIGQPYANSDVNDPTQPQTTLYQMPVGSTKIDMREQRREVSFRFTSNTIGGHFEFGHTILALTTGDVHG